MPSQSDYSDAFWLAYCDAIKGSWTKSDSTAIFFSQQGQLGPAAGPGVDERYTNYGIYQLGDNLLKNDSLSYTPSQSNSYSRQLLTFLDDVDLGAKPDETGEGFLAERQKDQATAQRVLDKAKEAAVENFRKDLELGIADKGTPFPVWANVNAPAYNAALKSFQGASAQVVMAQNRLNGPKAGEYSSDLATLTSALYAQNSQPGINMSVTGQTPKGAAEIRRAQAAGDKIEEPTGTYYVPDYKAPDYPKMVLAWINASGTDPANVEWNSATINFDKGKKVDKSEFGQTKVGADVVVPTPWFAVSAGGDFSSEKSFALKSTDQEKTTVTVKWTDRRLVTVSSGKWDIRNAGYKLKSTASKSNKNLVRPTQLVCFNNLCYDIKFEGESVQEVDQSFTEVKAGRAGLTIFGWNIGIGGSASTTKTETTHTATWDKQNGTLSIKPQQYGLCANIAAIIGEKLDNN